MKKIFLIIVTILISSSIFAQDYKPHSENNAIKNPLNVLSFYDNSWIFRDNIYSECFGRNYYIIPLYSPKGINEITIQIFASEEYFGSIVRKKEPTEEWVATYKNSVFQSIRRKGDDNFGKVSVNEGPFEKISTYDISTGKRLETTKLNILYRRRINHISYYSFSDLKSYAPFSLSYYKISSVGSIMYFAKYEFDCSCLSDRSRKQWNRRCEEYDNIIEFLRLNYNQELRKGNDLISEVYLNAYGIYKDFDFNNYNYHEKGKKFIKYILK